MIKEENRRIYVIPIPFSLNSNPFAAKTLINKEIKLMKAVIALSTQQGGKQSAFYVCMGRSNTSVLKLQQFARAFASNNNGSRRPAQLKPISKARPSPVSTEARPESHQLKLKIRQMEAAENSERHRRMPLAEVVSDCVNRWFQDTLKEAKKGDIGMQVLVGQMYSSGYGVAKNAQKGRAWIDRASKSRSSVWKVGEKHPGYNASDSDSDDANEGAK